MRLPSGTLKILSKETGYSVNYLSGVVAKTQGISPHRSIILEKACKKLGFKAPKELWLFGSKDEIKAALSNI